MFLCSEGRMRTARQIIFRYNGDPAAEEIDLDMNDDKTVPEQGSFVDHKGERWKVVQVKCREKRDRTLRRPDFWGFPY